MNLAAINDTVWELCLQLDTDAAQIRNWDELAEDDLLHEAAVCLFSSQSVFEVAAAAADRVRQLGLLAQARLSPGAAQFGEQLSDALSEPLTVVFGGKTRRVRLRFWNRTASMLAGTVKGIYGRGDTLHTLLASSRSARHARQVLIERVLGFGPKQASLFLRRVGYSSELAVLDRHVLDYFRLALGANAESAVLGRLSGYERIETEFQRVATAFGHSVGCVDLALWVTMRVAKREAMR
jgi:N-glycosylase/DNA lyase